MELSGQPEVSLPNRIHCTEQDARITAELGGQVKLPSQIPIFSCKIGNA